MPPFTKTTPADKKGQKRNKGKKKDQITATTMACETLKLVACVQRGGGALERTVVVDQIIHATATVLYH
jgi:hypothetical protein